MVFADRSPYTTPIPNFTQIRPVGVGLIHADRRTDMAKVKGYFRDYANAPKTGAPRDVRNKQLQHVRCNSTKPHSPFYRLSLFKFRVILTTLWKMVTG